MTELIFCLNRVSRLVVLAFAFALHRFLAESLQGSKCFVGRDAALLSATLARRAQGFILTSVASLFILKTFNLWQRVYYEMSDKVLS